MEKPTIKAEIVRQNKSPLTFIGRLLDAADRILTPAGNEQTDEEYLQKISVGKLPQRRTKRPSGLGVAYKEWSRVIRWGEHLICNNKPGEALSFLLGAQKAKDDDVLLLAIIGIAWRNLDDHRSAYSFFTRALEFRPESKLLQELCNSAQLKIQETQNPGFNYDSKPRIHIAILTFNALASTKMCIESIARTASVPVNVYVFDNLSQKDETRVWLCEQQVNGLKVHLNDVNLGVPGGRNGLADICLANAEDNDLVLFIDNDIEFFPGWDRMALELLDQHPEIGLLSADGHKIELQDPTRKLLRKSCRLSQIDTGCGYYFWVRAKVLKQVGGFDENLGLFWHEDDDFTIHVLANGYEAVALPQTPILHRAHQSQAANSGIALGGSPDNQKYLCQKWRAMGMVDGNNRIRRGLPQQALKQRGRNAKAGELFLLKRANSL